MGRKLNISTLDGSSTSVLVRQRGTVGHNLLNLDYLENVRTVDAARYGNIFSISRRLSAQIKTIEIISHSNSKYRVLVYRENTQSHNGWVSIRP